MQSVQAECPRVVFSDGGIERVIFTLPPTVRPDLPSVTAFALHKAGSVLLNKILSDMSRAVGLTYVSVADELFRLGMPWDKVPASMSDVFLPMGYCYGGFRLWPSNFTIPIIATSRPILLVRDPRDRLVSSYYSWKESHREPGNELTTVRQEFELRQLARRLDIDTLVRELAPRFLHQLTTYRTELCAVHSVRVYRYEEVIYDKASWVADLARHFGWTMPADAAAAIGGRHDVIPKREQTAKHIRQVHPGNFRSKLKQDTIDYLTGLFAEEMKYFGYDLR